MNEVDRWVEEGGPAPEQVQRLLDLAYDVPERTPEEAERSQRAILEALAEQDRRLDAEERAKKVARIRMAAYALAAAAVLAIAWNLGPVAAPVVAGWLGSRPERDGTRAGAPKMQTEDPGTSLDGWAPSAVPSPRRRSPRP